MLSNCPTCTRPLVSYRTLPGPAPLHNSHCRTRRQRIRQILQPNPLTQLRIKTGSQQCDASSNDQDRQTRNEGQQPLGEAEIDEALVRARKAEARAAEKAEIAKGQRLAVITGAVSIVFGVLYSLTFPLLVKSYTTTSSDIKQLPARMTHMACSCFLLASSFPAAKVRMLTDTPQTRQGIVRRQCVRGAAGKKSEPSSMTVRDQLRRTPEAEMARRKRDREDLYTDNWDGSEWKGKGVNILSIILIVSILTPLAGLGFAYWSYGRLWG